MIRTPAVKSSLPRYFSCWLRIKAVIKLSRAGSLKRLSVQVNQQLASRVFLCGHHLTLADLVVYGALHRPVVSQFVLQMQRAMSVTLFSIADWLTKCAAHCTGKLSDSSGQPILQCGALHGLLPAGRWDTEQVFPRIAVTKNSLQSSCPCLLRQSR